MTALGLRDVSYLVGVALGMVPVGVWVAWWVRRRTMLSIRNMYLAALLAVALDALAVRVHAGVALWVLVPLSSVAVTASAVGRRWRLSDLGAGEELRAHERQRRWLCQPRVVRAEGERVRIITQGQIVRERPWPASEPYVRITLGATDKLSILRAYHAGRATPDGRVRALCDDGAPGKSISGSCRSWSRISALVSTRWWSPIPTLVSRHSFGWATARPAPPRSRSRLNS